MTEGVDPRQLADGVLRTVRWSGHLPREERRTALRLWLAHRLAGQPRETVRRTLRELNELFLPPPAPQPLPRRETAADVPVEAEAPLSLDALIAFGRRYRGSAWQPSGSPRADAEGALKALAELEEKVRGAGSAKGEEGGLSAALDSLVGRPTGVEGALRKAAQESFDRLLDSLSPAAIEAGAGGKGMKLGPFHKASLYEAWCEKFEQVRTYHDSGRLVGDLRSSFKRYLRETEGQEGKG